MYTPLQKEEIRQELGRRRIFAAVLLLIEAPVLFIAVAYRRAHDAALFGYGIGTVRIVCIVVSIIVAVAFERLWRCPGCKARLPAVLRPEQCEECDLDFRATGP